MSLLPRFYRTTAMRFDQWWTLMTEKHPVVLGQHPEMRGPLQVAWESGWESALRQVETLIGQSPPFAPDGYESESFLPRSSS